METCVVCCEDFTDVGHFEITPFQRTGIKCGQGGHPLCNLCFARMWPHVCPVCKDEMRGFDFPKELALHLKAAKRQEMEVDDVRMASNENHNEVARLCEAQQAVLMMTQMFNPGMLEGIVFPPSPPLPPPRPVRRPRRASRHE